MIALNIANILKEKHSIAIASHVMPDGDSIGSILALYCVLKYMGKNVDVYCSDKVPDNLSFLPNSKFIKGYNNDITDRYDVMVVLDCGDVERLGECSKIANYCDLIINIDHHITNSLFGNLNLVDTNASATAELIYQTIKIMGVEISKDAALCLYTGILTDTGGFRYSNTTSITHQIAGDLINTGIDFGNVYERVYKSYKYDNIKLLGKVISSIELYDNGRIAFMKLLKNDFDGCFNANTSDFIDYGRDIESVEVAAFIKEVGENEFKVSLRSKHKADVRTICEKYGGGGHIKAAGCTMRGTLCEVKKNLIKELQNLIGNDNI